jgi:hypothetical protein
MMTVSTHTAAAPAIRFEGASERRDEMRRHNLTMMFGIVTLVVSSLTGATGEPRAEHRLVVGNARVSGIDAISLENESLALFGGDQLAITGSKTQWALQIKEPMDSRAFFAQFGLNEKILGQVPPSIGRPAIASYGGKMLAVWTELTADGETLVKTQLLSLTGEILGPAVNLSAPGSADGSLRGRGVAVSAGADGFGVVYMTEHHRDLYFTRVGTDGAPVGNPVRLNVSNGIRWPRVESSGNGYFASWMEGFEKRRLHVAEISGGQVLINREYELDGAVGAFSFVRSGSKLAVAYDVLRDGQQDEKLALLDMDSSEKAIIPVAQSPADEYDPSMLAVSDGYLVAHGFRSPQSGGVAVELVTTAGTRNILRHDVPRAAEFKSISLLRSGPGYRLLWCDDRNEPYSGRSDIWELEIPPIEGNSAVPRSK